MSMLATIAVSVDLDTKVCTSASTSFFTVFSALVSLSCNAIWPRSPTLCAHQLA